MRTRSTFSINFWINASRAKEGKAKLYARITIDSKRVNLSLKYTISAEDWDSNKSRIKGRSKETKAINDYLQNIHSELFQCYRELRSDNPLVTAEMVKSRYLGEDEEQKSLKDLFQYHNENSEHLLSKATISHYKTTQKYLLAYISKIYKNTDFPLKDLNHSFIVGFQTFLRNIHPKHHHNKIANNGAMKHIQRLRKMTTMALNNEWIEKNPFGKFKVKMRKKEREFLSSVELNEIQNYSSPIERLQIVKDLFVFSCYTGISYCDLMALHQDQMVIGIDKNYWIMTKRQKTYNAVRIPLLLPALSIIESYKNHPRRDSKKLLPKISNQKLNSYLKEVADACRISKNLTFHMARHTFATTVTLTNGVPIETVSKILGHSRLATTQIYARVLDQKVATDMEVLSKKLNLKGTATS